MSKKVLRSFASLILALAVMFGGVTPALAAPPTNDNFADATIISGLPFSASTDTTDATSEVGESSPTCGYGYNLSSAWFAYTPSTSTSITAQSGYYNFPPILAIYTGSLGSLTEVACGTYYPQLTIQAQAGVTYYFQLSSLYGEQGFIPFSLDVTPPPQVNISYYPPNPNIFDSVEFYGNAYDPGQVNGFSYDWAISDGTTSDQYTFLHQFAADGDYTVDLIAVTADGRSASASQVIQVRTRDVAISKFSVPQTARTNQTKTINVELKNNRYSDYVQVILFKGLPGGGEQVIGILTLYVPAKAKQATTFKFSYTFTPDDAAVGKVTFKAVATIVNGRDAFLSDNTSIVTTTVGR